MQYEIGPYVVTGATLLVRLIPRTRIADAAHGCGSRPQLAIIIYWYLRPISDHLREKGCYETACGFLCQINSDKTLIAFF